MLRDSVEGQEEEKIQGPVSLAILKSRERWCGAQSHFSEVAQRVACSTRYKKRKTAGKEKKCKGGRGEMDAGTDRGGPLKHDFKPFAVM